MADTLPVAIIGAGPVGLAAAAELLGRGLTPLLLEELRDAGERYPADWLIEAVREAVLANARSWRYIRKVLERWAADGRHTAAGDAERPIDIDRFTGGEYGGLFRRGGDESDL